ncbi:hypothetical protein GP2143_07554 [marine gamma proteobacterium HTCC2143]|uniref:Flagellar hook-length control protein-like C-terminal domain-containing protein n=1 Tax=marine gamma proteobacterium HTCC2143 TaxID=247633 RepID=A0YC68_9GAMM|nr:hypothetical protein GP2143_07554 [marine gamma proteobacterium HTCC2143]
MTVSSGYFIQQIIPAILLKAEILHQEMTSSAMKANTDSLINQQLPLKSPSGNLLNTTAKSGVMDAVVTSNSRIAASTSAGSEQFRINISVGQQKFELITNAPIAAGSRLQITITQSNLATILAITNPVSSSASNSTALMGRATLPTTGLLVGTSNTTIPAPSSKSRSAETHAALSNPLLTVSGKNRSLIEQGLRKTLPHQQPLKNLLPLLLKIAQQPSASWPKELTQNATQLLKLFPSSQQLQQSTALKQVISNSGIFLEAKLAQLSLNNPNNSNITTGSNLRSTNSALSLDFKGIIQRIILLTDNTAGSQNGAQAAVLTEKITAKPSFPGAPLVPSASGESSENLKPSALFQGYPSDLAASNTANSSSTGSSNDRNVDVLLRQLSGQLLASLARTQLNQLETLANRQQNTPDNQGPINSWTLEIPIIHGKNIDNLDVRIDQHLVDEEQDGSNKNGQDLWTIMLAFDLHKLGKMNVQLKVIDMSVSATVWSQLENTHLEVKREINGLKLNLEKIGVNVKKVDCKLGLPPKQNIPIYKQLVDVRT